jgi:putative ABC transport system permease protein
VTWLRVVALRIREIFAKRRLNAELDEELETHLEMLTDENMQRGMPAEEARREARIALGGVEQVKEAVRDQRGLRFLESFVADVRFGARMLRKSPGFTAVAVLTLALGIGANTAIFSVVNAVLLQPLSYPNPDRLVELELTSPQGNQSATSIPRFNVWREQTRGFDSVAAYDFSGPGINLTGVDRPEQLRGIHVSSDYFRVFGAPIAVGRTFSAEEDRPGGANVAVISNALWRGRFGGDPGIVDRMIDLGGEQYKVIGVLGPEFRTDPARDIWLPLRPDPNSTDQGEYVRVTARLKSGISLAQAQATMKLAAEEFKRKFPNVTAIEPKDGATALPLRDTLIGDVRYSLLLLLGAVGFVLLTACANVTNLLLARATIRRPEIAVRAALGAGRARIIRQLLTENLLLSLAGGVLGLGLGCLGVRALLAINPGDIPRIGVQGEVTLDWRVLAFTVFAAVLAGIVFGLVPALSASRSNLNSTLRESGSRTASGLRRNKARSVLAVTQMALALALLVGAGLLIRTFAALRGVNPGFDARNVLTMQMALAGTRFEKAASVDQLERDAGQRIGSLPGVTASALTYGLPLGGGFSLPFTIEGRQLSHDPFLSLSGWMAISPRYFDVFRIPVLSGRTFTDQDIGAADRVVVIDQALAKEFWPKGDALGARITIAKGVGPEFDEPPRQIVGIVGDVRESGLSQPPDKMMYVPVAQVTDGQTALTSRLVPMAWVVRTKYQPFSLSADIQRELREASGGLPVAHVRSMEQVLGESTTRSQFYMTLLTIFAGLALLLAAIGVCGLMGYSVQQRRQEIGLRMALGAQRGQVLRMVLRQGLLLTSAGIIVGLAASLALTRLLRGLLFEVAPNDPETLLVVTLVLLVVALAASLIPSWRATRVDPMVALRHE